MSKDEDNTSQIAIPFVTSDDRSGKISMRHDFEAATYTLSNMGQKVFYEVLAKLDSFKSWDNQVVCLTAAELDRVGIGFGRSQIYKTFKSACDEVQKLSVEFYGEDSEFDYEGSVNIFRGTAAKYKRNSKNRSLVEVYFSISPDAAPYLTELTKDMRFNQFLVDQTRRLKRASSMRLYQWLRKNHWITIRRPLTTVEITADELRAKLDHSNSMQEWKYFKRRILDPSVKEVNEQSDVCCDYRSAKTGRGGKVVTLIFEIQNAEYFQPSDDPQAKRMEGELIEKDVPELDVGLAAMIRAQLPGINEKVIRALAIFDKAIVMESLLIYAKAASERNIKKPVDYFAGIVAKKAKEQPSESKSQSLEEKLTDDSWAKDLDLDFDVV